MNYLAHFHLSYGDDQLLLGALLGDYIKGPLRGRLDPGLERGIWLHRKIDAFTDRHPPLRELQLDFAPPFRRYGGIMTDVVFDHFLSLHWRDFHHRPLHQFTGEVYRLLDARPLPHTDARQQAERLVRYDVLGSFHHWDTVEAALARIHTRLSRDNPLSGAAAELRRHYGELEKGFLDFYPQLCRHCDALRNDLISVPQPHSQR